MTPPAFDPLKPLGCADIVALERLLDEDQPEAIRAAALRALVRLPLEPAAWMRLARVVLRWLPVPAANAGPTGAPLSATELIELAVHVPVVEVRGRLQALLRATDPALRRSAALALAGAGDESAAPELAAALGGGDPGARLEAAEGLCRLSGKVGMRELKRGAGRDPRLDVRLLCALALARRGREAHLLDLVSSDDTDRLDPGRLDAGWWVQELAGTVRLPERAIGRLRALPPTKIRGEGERIVRAWCERCEPGAPTAAPRPPPDPVDRERARAWALALLARPTLEQAALDEARDVLGALSAEDAAALSIAIARLVLGHIETHPHDVAPGNVLVSLFTQVPAGWPAPIGPLFEYWLKAQRSDVRAQLAWVMSRGSLRHLVLGLGPMLASPEPGLPGAACELIEMAGRSARSGPRLFGAGAGGSEPTPPPSAMLLAAETHPPRAPAPSPAASAAPPPPRTARLGPMVEAARTLVSLPKAWLERGAGRTIVIETARRALGEPVTLSGGTVGETLLESVLGKLSGSKGNDSDAPAASDRTVSTGFATRLRPARPIPPPRLLAPRQRCHFWLEIGRPVEGSIESTATEVPAMAAGTRLRVALFGFGAGIELIEAQAVGELELVAAGQAVVVRQPGRREGDGAFGRAGRHRLFFPVRMPAVAGRHRLRCNIYHGQTLVQSRVVEAGVAGFFARLAARWRRRPDARPGLSSTVDYTLTQRFDPSHLESLGGHRLSCLLNDNGDGTHALRLFGEDGVPRDITLDRGALQLLVDLPRKALRHLSWGDENPWDPARGLAFRYEEDVVDAPRLANDLARLAVAGSQAWYAFTGRLDEAGQAMLAGATARPARLQIALKEGAHLAFPAGLLYDLPFDTNAFPLADTNFELCREFAGALRDGTPLLECACFRGECPLRQETEEYLKRGDGLLKDLGPRVCPGGFWGFRHELGMPLSLKDSPDAPAGLSCPEPPSVAVGVALTLQRWTEHSRQLPKCAGQSTWDIASSREDALRLLKRAQPHLVYFYCHGGVDRNRRPFLDLDRQGELGITPDNLVQNRIRWRERRPLVFLNGCHTTAVEDTVALEFVSGFVQRLGASGVIGTEVTIFEPLACAFAESFLPRFFAGSPVGQAVREARLALLARGNPLGLVYTPYVVPAFQLQRT